MFYLRYLRNELLRRRARTVLTLLGLEAAQRAYPVRPKGPDDTWWMPAHLGGTAPTPEEVRAAEAR